MQITFVINLTSGIVKVLGVKTELDGNILGARNMIGDLV